MNRKFVSEHVVQRFTVDDDLSCNKRGEGKASRCETLDEESGAEMIWGEWRKEAFAREDLFRRSATLLECRLAEVATRVAAQVAGAEPARMRDLTEVARVILRVAAVVTADALFDPEFVVASCSS